MKIKSQAEADKALAALEEQQKATHEAIRQYRGRKTFVCACLSRHPINTLTLIQDWAWSAGLGYDDGEWYIRSNYIPCPKNPEIVNRLDWPSYYRLGYTKRDDFKWNAEKQFKKLYKASFKEVVRTENRGLWASRNSTIDDNLGNYDITLGEE